MSANVPAKLSIGDTWSWTSTFTDYPATTWSVTFYFQNKAAEFEVTAAAAGSDHLAAIAAGSTAAFKPGRYHWRARAAAGAVFNTIDEGWLDVVADPSAKSVDPRSDARRMLDALNATLLGRASSDQLAMTIGGRSLSKIPLPELIAWRDRLTSEVSTEEKGAKAGLSRHLKSRFSRG